MAASKSPGKTSKKRRLFLVEDHPITREGFAQLIDYQPDLVVSGQSSTALHALPRISADPPDLIIVDISLPNGNGLELIKDVKAVHPRIPILVLSTHDEKIYAERALRAGAQGYVMKQAPTAEVMKAIRMVLNGEIYLSEPVRANVVYQHLHGMNSGGRAPIDLLTDRELEVFQLIGQGRTTRQIASTLRLGLSTVETHRAHLKEKLGLRNATELVQRAVEWLNKERW